MSGGRIQEVRVWRIPCSGPGDLRGARALIEAGELVPSEIVAVMGKTEGCPAAIIRGFVYEPGEGTARELIMPPERDLFR